MADNPTVTVIIATYNSSKTLRFAVASLLNQGFRDFEAWIVGDGCTDDSEQVVRGFDDARLHWFNLDKNHGSQAFPNNEGLRRAKGEFIAYLGHDDLWLPHHLETLVTRIQETNAAMTHSLCPIFNTAGVYRCFGPPGHSASYQSVFVPPSCWLHRRTIVDEIGLWGNPDKLAWQVDFDFMRRAALKSLAITCAPRLTLLKFPSACFRLYSIKGEPPQAHYWREILNNPVRVEQETQSQLVLLYATQNLHALTVLQQLAGLIGSARRTVKNILAAHEPFHTLVYKRDCILYQHARQAGRATRGLSGLGPTPNAK